MKAPVNASIVDRNHLMQCSRNHWPNPINKGNLDEALRNLKAALDIQREIGYRLGEANDLGNIGIIYKNKDNLDEALKNLKEALNILDSHGLVYGRDVLFSNILTSSR